jgi:CRISPR/Cas system-associated exonuclease Cas4 (RecB family)
LPDTNYWHYSLQLNTYKAILEKKYGKKVTDLYLVRLHPDNPKKTYELIKCADLSKEIQDLFEERKQKVL